MPTGLPRTKLGDFIEKRVRATIKESGMPAGVSNSHISTHHITSHSHSLTRRGDSTSAVVSREDCAGERGFGGVSAQTQLTLS